jgi:serine/threonine protein kinase
MSLLNSNREVPDTSTPIEKSGGETVHLPNIQIGNTTYQPVRYLGSGLYSDVYAYVALDGSGKEIAYKVINTLHLPEITIDGTTYAPTRPLEPGETEVPYRALDGSGKEYIYRVEMPPEAMEEFKNEIRSHAMLARGNHPNVVGLEGVIRMPNGQFGVAVEIAPGGDVLQFSGKLKDSIGTGEGKITPEMAEIVRLTLLRDMALGLGYIQTEQQSMHLDLKTPNVLIGNDGKAKISDFGLTRTDSHAPIEDVDLPDNPIWSAPEARTGLHEVKVMRQAMREVETGRPVRGIFALTPTLNSERLKETGRTVQREVSDVLPKAPEQTIRTLTTNIMKPDHAKLQSEVEVTGQSDTWWLGIMALDVWTV